MTKERIDAIRARCEAATAFLAEHKIFVDMETVNEMKMHLKAIYEPVRVLAAHSIRDIPALLEALSAETERADANKREAAEIDKNSAAKDKEYKKIINEITAERDQYKAQAESERFCDCALGRIFVDRGRATGLMYFCSYCGGKLNAESEDKE